MNELGKKKRVEKMVNTRSSSKKVVAANAAVNGVQQQQNLSLNTPNCSLNHHNQGKTCSPPASRKFPSGYIRRGACSHDIKKETQFGDLADNSHQQLQYVDFIQSSEAVIPAKKPQHEKEASNQAGMLQKSTQMQTTVIPDPAVGNSSISISATAHEELDSLLGHKTTAGSGGTKNADEITSRGGNNVASNNLNCGQGEISSNCFLGNGPQKSASFNLTEIAEKMGNDGLDEVDSFGSETTLVSVGGYKVKPKYEFPLGHILSKYGDIGVNCSRTVKFRSFYVELLCEIIQKLMDTNIVAITDNDLEEMISYVEDLEKENLDIGWLKERLNEIREAKQAIQILRSSSNEKARQAELKAEVKKRGQQLEDYKRELAVQKVVLQDLEKAIFAAERDIVAMKDGVTEVEKVISENKAKLRHFVKLGSLGQGLI